MERFTYGEFTTNKIADIPYGQPFQTDIIAEAMAEEYAIPVHKAKPITNVTLKRLADRGLIERFQKGVYYRAKQTVFGKARPSEDILEAQLLTRRGNEIIGYETGLSLMNKIGLTTLVPKKREIATNAYRKNINDRYIIARKPVITVNAGNFRYLQLLDVIRDLPDAPVDAENPKALLHAFAEKNGLDTVETLTYAKQHYSQKTLLNLIDVLVER
jgi:predicted transcriptional regulator of viral defense system